MVAEVSEMSWDVWFWIAIAVLIVLFIWAAIKGGWDLSGLGDAFDDWDSGD